MIEQIQFAKLFGVAHIDSLLQEMLLGGATIEPNQPIAQNTANSYQSTSDSADSPITSPITTQCHSPTDQLINGNIASPTNRAPPPPTNNNNQSVLIMSDLGTMDEDNYRIVFKEEPIMETEHY